MDEDQSSTPVSPPLQRHHWLTLTSFAMATFGQIGTQLFPGEGLEERVRPAHRFVPSFVGPVQTPLGMVTDPQSYFQNLVTAAPSEATIDQEVLTTGDLLGTIGSTH